MYGDFSCLRNWKFHRHLPRELHRNLANSWAWIWIMKSGLSASQALPGKYCTTPWFRDHWGTEITGATIGLTPLRTHHNSIKLMGLWLVSNIVHRIHLSANICLYPPDFWFSLSELFLFKPYPINQELIFLTLKLLCKNTKKFLALSVSRSDRPNHWACGRSTGPHSRGGWIH